MAKQIVLSALMFLLTLSCTLNAQDARQLVKKAVDTELAADRSDHSRWLYFDVDRKPDHTVKQWVAETPQGDLHRVMEDNGRALSEPEQRERMEKFMQDSSAQSKQKKAGQHDDQQAEQMLKMLPDAFVWTERETKGSQVVLHFTPNPQFKPPNYEARVFAAMEGDMAVDKQQYRIASLKGRMIRAVKFFGGLFGQIDAGGTFDVERSEVGKGVWQITATHVHIHGHALIFKTISDQEDEEKTQFKELPGGVSFAEAEQKLMAEK